MVSKDRHTTLLPTVITGPKVDASDKAPKLREVLAEPPAPSGFRVQAFGLGSLNADFAKVAEEDLAKGESVGMLAALIILVVVFGFGGFYTGRSGYAGPGAGMGNILYIIGAIVLIVLVLRLLRVL